MMNIISRVTIPKTSEDLSKPNVCSFHMLEMVGLLREVFFYY